MSSLNKVAKNRFRRTLLISIILRRRENKRKRRDYIRELFKNRVTSGESFLHHDLNFDPHYHQRYYRMGKENLENIFVRIKDLITRPKHHRYPISAMMKLGITLRYLATGVSQASLAIQYRISPASVSNIVRETMAAILKTMESRYLPKPSHLVWVNSANVFREKWNFPYCVGALDGKHVRIKAPWNSGSLNHNYKGFFSVVVLAVVSGDYKFLAVDIGAPGSESDAAIFSNTGFYRMIERKKLELPENGELEGHNVPHVIVGDEAFPLKPWLMRPFPGPNLEVKKAVFNYRLSRARRVVENAFGIWSTRWRILATPIDGDNDLINMIIRTTLVLHNFLREHESDDQFNEIVDEMDVESMTSGRVIHRIGSNNYSSQASDVREIFMNYFMSEAGRMEGQEQYVTRT